MGSREGDHEEEPPGPGLLWQVCGGQKRPARPGAGSEPWVRIRLAKEDDARARKEP